eukprot:GHVH01008593.1.p1 GENE.GHVH01008593.1~~GHVH01008593.1.p1  ORF type:complete len:342 (-),score=35.69 GHVH01008593.1:50-1075(-)
MGDCVVPTGIAGTYIHLFNDMFIQVVANYKEKSAMGYCYDLVVYNLYGFFLYSIYTVVQYRYQAEYDLEEAVEWQDLFFAFHSFSVNVVYLVQSWYYDGHPFFSSIGWFCKVYICVTSLFLLSQVCFASMGMIAWVSVPGAIRSSGKAECDWSVVESMGIIKALVTVLKFPSQVVMNVDRKSTKGMSVLGFVMDLFGGAAALAQNVTDTIVFKDMAFMTANIPKVIVAGFSVFWDAVLIYQGAWLYRNQDPLPLEQRCSQRKPDTRTAKILDFFAPAQWPPEMESFDTPRDGDDLTDVIGASKRISHELDHTIELGIPSVRIDFDDGPQTARNINVDVAFE